MVHPVADITLHKAHFTATSWAVEAIGNCFVATTSTISIDVLWLSHAHGSSSFDMLTPSLTTTSDRLYISSDIVTLWIILRIRNKKAIINISFPRKNPIRNKITSATDPIV
jgi:hypothetical protein